MTTNPRISVAKIDDDVSLTFWGPSLGNTQALEGITSEEDFARAVNALTSPTGVIRLELPSEEVIRDISVDCDNTPALTA